MKHIFIAVFFAVVLTGCMSEQQQPQNDKNSFATNATTNVIVHTLDFNQEFYIWENFNFSTNRVEKIN